MTYGKEFYDLRSNIGQISFNLSEQRDSIYRKTNDEMTQSDITEYINNLSEIGYSLFDYYMLKSSILTKKSDAIVYSISSSALKNGIVLSRLLDQIICKSR